MKRLKMTSGNSQRKFKLLFFDEKVAAVNLILSVLCFLLLLVYEFMQSNFPYSDVTLVHSVAEKVFYVWSVSVVILLFSWAWVTGQMTKFSIKKRIRGIIVAANVFNCLVLLLGEFTEILE